MSNFIIFDTDLGVDDSQALALLLSDPFFDIIGITTTFGNVSVATATRNTLIITEIAQRQIDVAQGMATPISKLLKPFPTHIHGEDGLGNQHLPAPHGKAHPLFAPQYLIEKTAQHPGEITIIATGPLGNLATALSLDPTLPSRVKQVVIMGGAVYCNGNVTPAAEANIYSDPNAAAKVFAANWPIVMVGLDVTLKCILPPEVMEKIVKAQPRLGDLLWKGYQFYAEFYRQNLGIDGCIPHDSLTIAYLRHPEFFTTEIGYIHVETEGLMTGFTLFAHQGGHYIDTQWQRGAIVNACIKVDAKQVINWMLETLTNH